MQAPLMRRVTHWQAQRRSLGLLPAQLCVASSLKPHRDREIVVSINRTVHVHSTKIAITHDARCKLACELASAAAAARFNQTFQISFAEIAIYHDHELRTHAC